MPEVDSFKPVNAIKQDPSLAATRLVMLSSLGAQLSTAEMETMGIDESIVKPLKQSSLQHSLTTIFGRHPEHVPDPAPGPQPTNPYSKSLRILVAEDNSVNQKVVLLQLKRLGYSADTAEDGHEVLAAFEKVPYDIVLMDCQMPLMDGYAASRKLRELYQRPISIIAMTANAMPTDRTKCLDAGMDDYLSKPVTPAELRRVLEAARPKTTENPPADPTDTSPVELDRLLEITGNQPEMFRQIVSDYLAQADEIMTLMVLAIERRDAEDLRQQAHKLGGSSASCGMVAIVPLLARIELMGAGGQLAIVRDLQHQAARQLERIRGFLTRYSKAITHEPPIRPCPEY